jgi:N-acetylglucosaminyldiphosphoundecaprenol N-acetyl-beta-D-mannosaminyltransferase
VEEVESFGAGKAAGYVSYRVLGAPVTAVPASGLLDLIESAIAERRRLIVASQNMHGLHTYLHDHRFRELHEHPDTVVHIDGTPLLWFGRARGFPIDHRHRTGVIDWLPLVLRRAETDEWRIYHLGGDAKTLRRALEAIRDEHPRLTIDGHHGFFENARESSAGDTVGSGIAGFRPDILLVGMGMGRQESWIMDHMNHLEVPVIITTGACIRMVAGELPTAPRWMGRVGLEWAYRFAHEPRSTFRRYFIEPIEIVNTAVRRRGAQR